MPLIGGRQQWYEEITPPVDGLYFSAPNEVTPVGAAVQIDWYHDVDKELRKCLGRMKRSQLGTTPVRGMYMWHRSPHPTVGQPEPDDQFIIHTNDSMYITTDFINFELKESGLLGWEGAFVCYAPVQPGNKLLFLDGIMEPRVYDGTTVSNLVMPPSVFDAMQILYYKRRTLLINVFQDPRWEPVRIWWSQIETIDVWDVLEGAGFIDWAEGGGSIYRAVLYNDTVVMFKKTHIGVLSHTAQEAVPFRIQDFAEAPGTIYPYSVAVTPFGVVYFATDGVRIFDGQRSRLVASDALKEVRFG